MTIEGSVLTATQILFLGAITGFGISIIFFIRNRWVFNARQILLRAASIKAKEAIENEDGNWKRYYDWYESLPSYNKMMFLISVWDVGEWLKTIPE